MIYSRYNAPDSVLNLPYEYGLDILFKALEKDLERNAWELWLTFNDELKKETPFTDFLSKIKEPAQNNDTRTEEEILQDAENILNSIVKRT